MTDGTNLVPRAALLDAMEDDDDIEWPEDPFDRPHRAEPESPDELLAMLQFEGTPAKVMSMVIDIDQSKWELPWNRLPQRHQSAEKQTAISRQVEALMKLGVIEESRAAYLRFREA